MTAPAPLPLAMIAAVARNGVIGAGNTLPWRLPSDLRHFRAVTMGRPVLMGRTTFQSIGGPLPGRAVIVVSRNPAFQAPDVQLAATLEQALDLGETIGRQQGAPEVLVAGGGTVYAALIHRARRLYITHVDIAPEGDTRFPLIDPAIWRATARAAPAPTTRDEAHFAFVTYERH